MEMNLQMKEDNRNCTTFSIYHIYAVNIATHEQINTASAKKPTSVKYYPETFHKLLEFPTKLVQV